MSKAGGVFLLTLFFAAQGCSQNEAPKLPESGEQTLKALIQERDAAAEWTINVEPPVEQRARVSTPITADNVYASRAQTTAEIIYPELDNFGPIDTSLLGENERAVISSFCAAVIAKNKTQSAELMNPGNAFLLTVFFDDVKNVEFTDRFVVGRPGMRGNLWQVPVRFFVRDGSIDMRLFFTQGESSIVIDQISYGQVNG